MGIYTRTGDQGMTGLWGKGTRVPKSSLQVHVLGGLDEINSYLGFLLAIFESWFDAYGKQGEVKLLEKLRSVKDELSLCQSDLFLLGSQVAAYRKTDITSTNNKETEAGALVNRDNELVIGDTKWFKRVEQLERQIDQMEAVLPELTNFILPGGSLVGAQLHLVRAVIRRVERDLVRFGYPVKKDALAAQVLVESGVQGWLVYLNRLSDYFFVSARYVNEVTSSKEIVWRSPDKGE